ncbi:MAG: glutamate--tRNA ligase [bacterium]|nr:glutamate--tRNA ligase [bacterium]
MTNKKIRTRIAPSPTGFVHIGNLRTALYNYLFTKQQGGDFVLRIEDTDQSRKIEGAMEKIFEVLEWSGLSWNEGPLKGGEYGPYIQSQRLDLYKKYARQLVDSGHAYYCFCTPKDLEQMREEQTKNHQAPHYAGPCREADIARAAEKIKTGSPFVIRLKVPKNELVTFDDIVYGKISFNSKEIDDQVLLKSDGFPTYHLAVVVDDHLMKMTHIMRGEDWLPSTPKHILLYEAFGWEKPVYCHLPNILGEDKKKLSKRTAAVSVEDFKKAGYLPAALINYLALLGWNPGTEEELFLIDELIKKFDLKKIHKAGAIFDLKKLDNINGQYIRNLQTNKLVELCLPYLKDEYGDKLNVYSEEYINKVIKLEQERLKKLSDIAENARLFFSSDLKYDSQVLVWKKSNQAGAKKVLDLIFSFLKNINEWNKENLEAKTMAFIGEQNLTNGETLWPLRVALSGQQNSPGPFEIADVLGQEQSLHRIAEALKKLE